jgi:SpoVK/Ycf46/Vps4 family AAA+-type ATPase
MNPTNINNFNKLLITLDNNNSKIDEMNNLDEMKNNEEYIKNVIDKIINRINNNLISSPNFTGQSLNDFSSYEAYDPNKYIDYDKNLNYKYMPDRLPIEKKNLIKETINIEAEINSIEDILKLIDTYKDEPTIKYNINIKALHSIKEPLSELNSMVGMKELKNNIVDQILYFTQELHKNKNSLGEYLHTVIYGPPGTGKTDIAKIMGKIYSKIGILSNGTFKKVTRSDLIAGYLGQTALKTKAVIEEAIGGVLFIDEAYSLGNPEKRDSFSKECIDTLCEALSDKRDNLMVIIAGYEKELRECFFGYNQGLDSRFIWRFKTDDYTHDDLYKIFLKKVNDIGWEIENNTALSSEWFKKNKEYFRFYGRDIETLLGKTKIAHSRRVFCKPESEKKKLSLKDLNKGLDIFLKNDDIKSKKEEEELKKQVYYSLYC